MRVPASFCGIHGIRPTLGRISLDGVLKQAESYDTAGWFADDPQILARVGAVLLDSAVEEQPLRRLIVADDAFALAGDGVAAALAPALDRVKALAAECESMTVCAAGLEAWNAAMHTLHQWEAHRTFGDWINQVNPRFAYEVARRFVTAALVTEREVEESEPMRRAHRQRMAEILTPGSVIALPSAPGPAPPLDMGAEEMWDVRWRLTALTCIAGGAGVPQISLPLATVDGLPVGLSLIAPAGADESLLHIACRI